ncbi:uncharacterized protein LOC130276416 isoform X2 [Hyla sarda]|uniref:uncharacterized protein LOC130276416 isoform X2 n=1 Tax=Hyla sarda TaxID=327740 RepID=UPI0024C22806|nr:uncharacterized protein LOC130276416 isoform X2 [Hyla sarda]
MVKYTRHTSGTDKETAVEQSMCDHLSGCHKMVETKSNRLSKQRRQMRHGKEFQSTEAKRSDQSEHLVGRLLENLFYKRY